MTDKIDSLSEKEKDALRLLVRGHDAKSSAIELGLSVHTINERLRAARQKLEVTSSREAARMLLEGEGGTYEKLGYESFGDAETGSGDHASEQDKKSHIRTFLIGGSVIMLATILSAAFFIAAQPISERVPGDPATAVENAQLDTFEAVAREWLTFVDAGDWDASFAAAGRSFRDPNTVAMWRDASRQARVPLGAMMKREVVTIDFIQPESDSVDAETKGPSAVVRFSTTFENRADAVESVTLEQEHGEWKVVGYLID